MSFTSDDGTTPSTLHSLPPRQPRYTTQDYEDIDEAKRIFMLREATKDLIQMHTDLHQIFGEAVRSEDDWPFFLVRYLHRYVEKSEFEMMTKYPEVLAAARQAALATREQNVAKLSTALISQTGLALAVTSGEELLSTPRLLKKTETDLKLAQDMASDAGKQSAIIANMLGIAHDNIRAMIDTGGALPDISKARLQRFKAHPSERAETASPLPRTPRAHHLRMSEHWVRVSKDELHLMELNLLADYADKKRGDRVGQAQFDGILLSVTQPQRDFIEADAHSHRDLGQADKALHMALTH